jgi:hypothetical protein
MSRITAALTYLKAPQAQITSTCGTNAAGTPISLRIAVAALAAGGLAAAGLLAPMSGASASGTGQPAAAATVATSFGLGHHAFGTKIDGNPAFGSGPTANSVIGCTNLAGLVRGNSVAAVNAPPLLTANEVHSVGTTSKQDGVVTVTSRNTITSGSLLGGDVSFRGLSSQSRTWHDDTGFHNRVDFDLARLVVNGETVALTGGRQRIDLPTATLTLFAKTTKTTSNAASARGLALKLVLDAGTRVQVGSSYSRMLPRVFGPMSGSTWASQVSAADKVLRSGRTAYQVMPCQGTDGVVRENATGDVDVNLLRTTDVATHVWGIQGPTAQRGYTQAQVAKAFLPTLALRAEGIVSKADVKRDSGGLTRSADGTHLLRVTLGGLDVTDRLEAGVAEDLGPVTVTFKKVNLIRDGIEVVALEVAVDGTDTVIELGHSTMRIAQN